MVLFYFSFLKNHPSTNNRVEFEEIDLFWRIGNILARRVKIAGSGRRQHLDWNRLAPATGHIHYCGSMHAFGKRLL